MNNDGTKCVNVTTCTADEWESSGPTASSDRNCSSHSMSCPTGQYTFAPPTYDADRVCHTVTTCVAGRYQTVAPTASSDRECTACEAGQYQDHENKFECIPCAIGKHRTREPSSSPESSACSWCTIGRYASGHWLVLGPMSTALMFKTRFAEAECASCAPDVSWTRSHA